MKSPLRRVLSLLAIAGAVLLATGPQSTLAAEPALKVGVPVWVGWMPWWVAQEKGLFKANGLEVELRNFAVQGDAVLALASGKLDAASVATNDVLTVNADGPKASVVLLHDESAGADMMISRGIETPAGLKGQRIAVEVGGVSHFFLSKLLSQNGLSESDVTVVNMTAADAGAAFVAKAIPVVVTWEPYGTQGIKSGGKLLLSSKDTPGAIVDVLGVGNGVLKDHPEQVRKLVKSWFDALAYVGAHQEEAFAIMAKASGVSVAEFAEMWKGVRIFSAAENASALAAGGTFHGTVDSMGAFMVKQKLLAAPVASGSMVSATFLPKPAN